MKKLIFLIGFSIVCFAASAQPTSFGGITPGQTTREELKGLVKKPNEVGTENYASSLELIQPDMTRVSVMFFNDIVYAMEVSLDIYSGPSTELKQALIEKYGQPRIKVGSIRTVKCGNKFGASFDRFAGNEELKWPVKDGVQGALRRWAGNCAEHTYEDYWLRHVATVNAVERAKLEKERGAANENRRNLGNAY